MHLVEIDLQERIADLKKQHQEEERRGYDGHNRHPMVTSLRTLVRRRERHVWNARMRKVVQTWIPANSNN